MGYIDPLSNGKESRLAFSSQRGGVDVFDLLLIRLRTDPELRSRIKPLFPLTTLDGFNKDLT
jgi:hypothetical protein